MHPVEAGVQLFARVGRQLVRQAVVLGQSLGPRAQSAGDFLENRTGEPLRHFLGKHGGDEPLLPGDFALLRFEFSLNEPQQGGFAHAVATQQTHPLATFENEARLVQNQRAAEAQT